MAHSLSGTSARLLSARRPVQTIHALTPDVTSLKALNFSWGVLPHQVGNDNVGHLARAERFIASSLSLIHIFSPDWCREAAGKRTWADRR